MLSKKTRYAMLALIHLAREYGRGSVAISEIAGNEMIPQRFLEGILLELKKEGILESTRGKLGGYYLKKAPAEVDLARVVTIFEGSVGMLACTCDQTYQPCEFCKDEAACKLRRTFQSVHESTFSILKATTLAELV